jgi:hypothetical protein
LQFLFISFLSVSLVIACTCSFRPRGTVARSFAPHLIDSIIHFGFTQAAKSDALDFCLASLQTQSASPVSAGFTVPYLRGSSSLFLPRFGFPVRLASFCTALSVQLWQSGLSISFSPFGLYLRYLSISTFLRFTLRTTSIQDIEHITNHLTSRIDVEYTTDISFTYKHASMCMTVFDGYHGIYNNNFNRRPPPRAAR